MTKLSAPRLAVPRSVALRAAALLLAASALPAAWAQTAADKAGPPVAPVRPVTDTYFGQAVPDPYRWMENLGDPAVKAWFRGQADYTQAVLAPIPGRAALLARIHALDNAGVNVSALQVQGGRFFYKKIKPGELVPKLYTRIGLAGAETLLLDPQAQATNGVHSSLDYFGASLDGKYVVAGLSPGGSENSVIRVLDASTGRALGEGIDRTRFGSPSWRPDGRSFFYNRLPAVTSKSDPLEGEGKSVVYLHTLGSSPDRDPAVFGYGVSPSVPILPNDISFVQVNPGSPYAYGVVEHGVQNEVTLYAAPLASVTGPETPWRKVADVADQVTGFDARGDVAYLLSHKGAARFQVVSTSLSRPDMAHPSVVVPASSVVIKAMAVAQDALYVQDIDGGVSRLRRVAFDGGRAQDVPLPVKGSISELIVDPRRAGAFLRLGGWTQSSLYDAYDPGTGRVADTGLKPPSPVNTSRLQAVEVKARGADGTLIPLSIISQKGIRRDGSHPTLLIGYGSYGITLDPGFNPVDVAWIERGGVVAVAHVRGGGEYGEDWHQGGQKLTKHNTWQDFLACGRYLIDQGYTTSARLAGQGGSAGGITVGRALTEDPGLFAAILDDVGSSNTVRAEFSPNGPPNTPEFGTVADSQGFKALYAMDSYLHVQNGVRYPAVMLTTGINDPRVASWELAKMAARLQAATASGKPILLRVDYDAGHGIGSTQSQYEAETADEWSFLLQQFGDPAFQPKPTAGMKAGANKIGVVTPITITGE